MYRETISGCVVMTHWWILIFPTFVAAQESMCDSKIISELFLLLPKWVLIDGRLLSIVGGMQRRRFIPLYL